MKIDFDLLTKEEKVDFKNGKGITIFQAYRDETNTIFRLTINPGCSVGFHKHESSQELMYLLSGEVEVRDDSETYILKPGQVTYCKDQHCHSITNNSKEVATLICSVTMIAHN